MNLKTIISKLREQYLLNITPVMEDKIVFTAKDSDNEYVFIDKFITDLFSKSSPLFKKRELINFIADKIEEKGSDITNILIIGNDSGQFISSLYIAMAIKGIDPGNVNMYWMNISMALLETFEEGSFSHDDLLMANADDLKYFNNKQSCYMLDSKIIDSIQCINCNIDMPFTDSAFDFIVCDESFSHYNDLFHKEVIDNIYRVIKPKGLFFVPEKNIEYLVSSIFDYRVSEEKIYFVKEGGSSTRQITEFSMKKAVELFQDKHYEDALVIIHHLINQNLKLEELSKLYKLLLVIYSRQDDSSRIMYLEKIIRTQGIHDADIDFIIGSYYFSKMDYSTALGYFSNALTIKQNFAYASYYAGLIYKQMGKQSRAVDCFKNTLEMIENKNTYDPQLFAASMSYEMVQFIINTELG